MGCFDSFFILLGRPFSVLFVSRHDIVLKEIATTATRDFEELLKVAAVAEWYRCGLPGHEFEPSTTKDPPSRATMHVKSVES
ncbi:hypothetical protein TNCV_679401 [Trichonephila clavipes]|nr:hypothetical protein TNCV_679401 [Trichonephila clavipes]